MLQGFPTAVLDLENISTVQSQGLFQKLTMKTGRINFPFKKFADGFKPFTFVFSKIFLYSKASCLLSHQNLLVVWFEDSSAL